MLELEVPTRLTPIPGALPWIKVAPNAPYFITESGECWNPIGQNDAITWPEFSGLFRRKNLAAVESHLAHLVAHGVTCLRIMLEYAQTENRYFENPVGNFKINMIKLWDDLFALCEKYRLRILLTPYDTFWMWIRWKHHPYNRLNGGPCAKRSKWLLCPDTLQAIKNRLTFAAERWGGSGALFAWDLWNEIHPAHAENNTAVFYHFISEISTQLRQVEMQLYGRTHLQTVSLFGPVLYDHPKVADVIFRHPLLDFATTHFYDNKTINRPKNTIAPAVRTGAMVREALEHLHRPKPFFDIEHGPIYTFKNWRKTLPVPFDEEYFRHMQWAHLASGAAGGGMRWPYRRPHVLTAGMRQAQSSLAAFTRYIDWSCFNRRNLNQEIKVSSKAIIGFCCADGTQAIVWLLRKDNLSKTDNLKMVDKGAAPVKVKLRIPFMQAGQYQIYIWDTLLGKLYDEKTYTSTNEENLIVDIPSIKTDIALAIKKIST